MRWQRAVALPLCAFGVLSADSLAYGWGEVVAWGDNRQGQCVVPEEARSAVTMVAAGAAHSLALKNGKVIAWGSNQNWLYKPCGQCDVPPEARSGVDQIAAGAYHSMALKNGKVLVWGLGIYGALQIPPEAQSGVHQIAAGLWTCYAVKDGKLLMWGPCTWGGWGPICDMPPEASSGVAMVDGGYYHSLVLKGGRVFAWGGDSWRNFGQRDVPAEAKSGVDQIAATSNTSIALKDGKVILWGENPYWLYTVPPEAQSGVTMVAVGTHILALKGGSVLAWGYNDYGQCDVPPDALSGVIQIAAGGGHSLALKEGKPIWLTASTTAPYRMEAVSVIANAWPLTTAGYPFVRIEMEVPPGQGGVPSRYYVQMWGPPQYYTYPVPIFPDITDPVTTAAPVFSALKAEVRFNNPGTYHLEAGAIDPIKTTSPDSLVYVGLPDKVTFTVR